MEEFHLECHPQCSLAPGTPNSEEVTRLLVEGKSLRAVAALVNAHEGDRVNITTIGRHKKHIVMASDATEDDLPKATTNIEILEAIIAKGFQNRKNWRPTISDTMKAMDMWFRLTQGNPFDDLLDTLAAASTAGAGATGPTEDPAAVADSAERDEGAEDDS
jgi:hypothetical protein